jgi:hypothetical protein
LAINLENQERTHKKSVGKMASGPKMNTGIYGTQFREGKWKKLQKIWKPKQGVGPITKVLKG